MSVVDTFALTEIEIRKFDEQGYLGPYTLVAPEEMREMDQEIERQVFGTEGPSPGKRMQSRHMDCPIVYEIASQPEILDRVASLFGPHLLLWATYFFNKEPGGKEIPWHQDLNYWPLEPLINISAWIAVDEATLENSCVQVIPKSHRKAIPHVPAPSGVEFEEMADPRYFDASQAVPIELKAGEFFLFNEKTLHFSEQNRSQRRRRGMTVRITIPIVRIVHDTPPLHPGHKAILLRGDDYMGFNKLCDPPLGTR
jgi:hypothetical protein